VMFRTAPPAESPHSGRLCGAPAAADERRWLKPLMTDSRFDNLRISDYSI
jgi:hypothetical protein